MWSASSPSSRDSPAAGTLEPSAGLPALPGADGAPFTYTAEVVAGSAVRVVFGRGTVAKVAEEAMALGSRVLVISGRHEAAAASTVCEALAGSCVGWISGVAQHVPVDVAAHAIDVARAAGADAVVSIGGGSATGLAKAVARSCGLTIIAVPTTYAGSEMTPIWGQTDEGGKSTGRSPDVLPRTVVYDAELTVSMPAALTGASGMNALAHAVESLYAPDRTDMSSAVAEEAIRSLVLALPGAVDRPDELSTRSLALRGAWLAGWALGATTMGLHHKLAHVIGGRYRLPHAGLHSALLPQVAAFNAPAAADAFIAVARALAVPGPEDVGSALFQLTERVGAPTSLEALGLPAHAAANVVPDVLAASTPNPRAFSKEDLESVLLAAYRGDEPVRSPAPQSATQQP